MLEIQVKKEMIPQAWTHAMPWIQISCEKGRSFGDSGDILSEITSGEGQLYKLVSGENFAWVVMGKIKNVAIVSAIGGRGAMLFLGDITKFCERWGKNNGCSRVACCGRKGWSRSMSVHGWKELSRTCGKEI